MQQGKARRGDANREMAPDQAGHGGTGLVAGSCHAGVAA